MIKSVLRHGLTQGVIFTCAVSDEYPHAQVKGLVITARCDVAHGKAPIISYVPIINFKEWVLNDGVRILALRSAAAANGAMKAALKELNMNASIIDTLPIDIISSHLNTLSGKAEKAAAKRFDDAVLVLKSANGAIVNKLSQSDASVFIAQKKKDYEKLSQELLSNQLSDFHYLEACEPDEVSNGHVVLMREIRYLPSALATYMASGIDQELYIKICKESATFSDKLGIKSKDHFAMPIGILQSPFIEFFMQRFTQLFARIGVTDIPPAKLQAIKSLVPFEQEKSA